VPSGVARGLAILDLERAGTGSPIAIIFFANGSSHLSANDRAMLGKVAGAQRTSGGALRVVGHASSPTNAKDLVDQRLINFEVSLDRASAAMEELIRHGVPAASIHSDAVSANRPVSNESLPGGVASNRRVEIFLDY
jgi:flagellar motor protein MotB